MKTVIQHTGAPLYWSPRGWTNNPAEALVFLDDVRARDYAFLHDIEQGTSAVLEETPRWKRIFSRVSNSGSHLNPTHPV